MRTNRKLGVETLERREVFSASSLTGGLVLEAPVTDSRLSRLEQTVSYEVQITNTFDYDLMLPFRYPHKFFQTEIVQ